MKKNTLIILIVFCSTLLRAQDSISISGIIPINQQEEKSWLTRFQKEIDEYRQINDTLQDKSCDVLFLGSSSIVMWDHISKDLAPMKIIRRSYGGSTIRDILYNYNVIAKCFRPKQIVLYVENDLSNSKEDISVGEIYDLFRLFSQKIKQDYPNVPFYIMSFKPSPSRAVELVKQKQINQLLEEYAQSSPQVYFIDITKDMYNERGKLKMDIWKDDLLHMNRKGYAIWTKTVKPILLNYKPNLE